LNDDDATDLDTFPVAIELPPVNIRGKIDIRGHGKIDAFDP
jgi:hypothetical protein